MGEANIRSAAMQTFLKIDMDDDIESTSEEVDALLDYMDERVEQGVQPEEVMAAIVVVLALISGETGDAETLH
jgi:hypothetical protein